MLWWKWLLLIVFGLFALIGMGTVAFYLLVAWAQANIRGED